jgi:cytochrome c6
VTPAQGLFTLLALLLLVGTASCATGGSPGSTDTPEDALMALGRAVFTELSEPRCGACHILGDAGTTGMIGPDLDELQPDTRRVVTAIRGGVGVMRPQDHLTDEQVEAVARYVARTAGRRSR